MADIEIFETVEELKKSALVRSGELIDGTSDYDSIALEQINDGLRKIFSGSNAFNVNLGEPWEWAKSKNPGILTLLPVFETGTVSFTNASTAGTFSLAPSVSLGSFAGRLFSVSARDTVYRIASHVAGATSFILDQEYLESTGTALKFKAIQIDYDLTDGIERLIGPMRTFGIQSGKENDGQIQGLSLASFDREFKLNEIQVGTPDRFAFVYQTDGKITVRFNRYPASNLRVEYDFIPVAPRQQCREFETSDVGPREVQLFTLGSGIDLAASEFLLLENALGVQVCVWFDQDEANLVPVGPLANAADAKIKVPYWAAAGPGGIESSPAEVAANMKTAIDTAGTFPDITVTDNGNGTVTITQNIGGDVASPVSKTVDEGGIGSIGTSIITEGALNNILEPNHGLQNNQMIRFTTTGTLPSGLLVDTNYYLVGRTAGSFQVSLVFGGTAITFTSRGTGVHTFSTVPPMPTSYRQVLAYYATHFIMTDKSDSRSNYYFRQVQDTFQSMITSNRKMRSHVSKTKGRMMVRMDGETIPRIRKAEDYFS